MTFLVIWPDEDLAWRARARCHGVDPGLFYPERGESADPAKAVCRPCPVREQCLSYALDNNEEFGVWGGTSQNDRRKMRRRRPLAARLCEWCRAAFRPRTGSQLYCQPEHASLAASARKSPARRAG